MMAFLFHGPWCLDFDEWDMIGGLAEVFIMYSLTGKTFANRKVNIFKDCSLTSQISRSVSLLDRSVVDRHFEWIYNI